MRSSLRNLGGRDKLETIVSKNLLKVKRIHLGYPSDYDTKFIELADRAQVMTSNSSRNTKFTSATLLGAWCNDWLGLLSAYKDDRARPGQVTSIFFALSRCLCFGVRSVIKQFAAHPSAWLHKHRSPTLQIINQAKADSARPTGMSRRSHKHRHPVPLQRKTNQCLGPASMTVLG